ncbi:MAG: hypothetical protein ABIQ93_09565, partial [Saprospiraceae bacterium]
LLDKLETRTPDKVSPMDVANLRKTLETDAVKAISLEPKAVARHKEVLARATEYLEKLRPEGGKNPLLAEEMAAAYQQVGVMEKDEERAKVSFRAAADLLNGLPEERRRLADVERRVAFLEQKIGKPAVKPAPLAEVESIPTPPPMVAAVPAPTAPVASRPVDAAPTVVTVPSPVAAAPVSRISAEEASAMETKLIGVMAKAENAEASVASLQADLQRKGLSIHPSTIDALASMRAAVARAKRQFAAGDVSGVSDSLAAADVFASRALKAAGR